ncbi:DNA-binding response regulator [Mucilaginibacter terrenus]|uniref:DNA-binding response regulator n=1 Tax=Mucilaginibacter terrenus TaxID=2482727 RepID=A0A3E2NTG5_9SPHI|nr:LytTR family DNA-binding domain-containing protein [Mucilaginibacter terrenus]RFZ84298.1 DNA-binding response regulator [Mucilaginibacter terrenus]
MTNCIVVDDEPLARQLLEGYINQTPGLNCIAVCQSAVEAFAVLHQQKVDLMFLDIQMPGITGVSFLRSLKNAPRVIFTTAYTVYAVEAFELEATDYLQKPITFERFMKAVQKVWAIKDDSSASSVTVSEENPFIFLKVDRRLVKVDHADIVYVEGYGDYLKVHTKSQTHITYMTFGKLEQLLPGTKFIRIHRSVMVNAAYIEFAEGNYLRVNGHDLPIGSSYRDKVFQKLNLE